MSDVAHGPLVLVSSNSYPCFFFPQLIVEGKQDTVVQVLGITWTYLLERQGKGTSFWIYLEGYTDMAFQRALMTQPQDSPVTQKLMEVQRR